MVHYLRNEKNGNVIEVSTNGDDLSSNVYIHTFSMELRELIKEGDEGRVDNFVDGIEWLSEIRGWWFEKESLAGNWDDIDAFVEVKMRDYGNQLCLFYVSD